MKEFVKFMGALWVVITLILFIFFIIGMFEWNSARWIVPTAFFSCIFSMLTTICLCYNEADQLIEKKDKPLKL